MAFNRGGDFSFKIVDDFDKTIDEKGNNTIALRKICWGNSDVPRLDLRKYAINADGQETMLKGVSFLTEEGPHELAKVLVEEGFGHTDDIVQAVAKREDFRGALNKVLSPEDEHFDESVGEVLYEANTSLFDYDEE